jgi:hypothetical protein
MKRLRVYIAMLLLAGMLIGISSGGFVNEPSEYNKPGWKGFPAGFISDKVCPFGCVKPFNWSEYLYPDTLQPQGPDTPPLEPIPLVMPQPIPITKTDLFKSMTTISTQKESLISSLSSGKSLPVSF